MRNSDVASDGSDNVSRFSALVNLTYFFNVSDLKAILEGAVSRPWRLVSSYKSIQPCEAMFVVFFWMQFATASNLVA